MYYVLLKKSNTAAFLWNGTAFQNHWNPDGGFASVAGAEDWIKQFKEPILRRYLYVCDEHKAKLMVFNNLERL
jgi:hypothetical protein